MLCKIIILEIIIKIIILEKFRLKLLTLYNILQN